MQLELRIDGSRFRELDILVSSDEWLNEQANRLAGWEILVRTAKAEPIEPISQWDLCDRIGFPRVLATIKKIKKTVA